MGGYTHGMRAIKSPSEIYEECAEICEALAKEMIGQSAKGDTIAGMRVGALACATAIRTAAKSSVEQKD